MVEKSGDRMSWGKKLALWTARKSAAYAGVELSLSNPKGWSGLLGNSTYAGKTVNDETAMQISVVWACIKILSESVGALPLGIFEKEKNGNAHQVDHPLSEILIDAPNADMTSQEFREAKQTNLGLRGNGYSLKELRPNGNVASLYPIPAQNCVPEKDRETGLIFYKFLDRGKWETLPREKIWHIKGFGSTGLMGYSPIAMARQAMGLSLATEEFGSRFFSQGAKPSGLVKIPTWLKEDQRAIARENIAKFWQGLENAQKLVLLEGGMDYESVSMPLEDAQFLQTRRFQLHEICRIYRVPPHMVADLERATFSNIEQMSLEFVQFTLLPWLTRWERSAERWLLKPEERGRFFIRLNFEGMLRADSQARADYLTKLVANGLMSRNEARAKENMNGVQGDGMDAYTVQSNMIGVDELDAIAKSMRGSNVKSQPQIKVVK
jgi:HK97 family phage portal protein